MLTQTCHNNPRCQHVKDSLFSDQLSKYQGSILKENVKGAVCRILSLVFSSDRLAQNLTSYICVQKKTIIHWESLCKSSRTVFVKNSFSRNNQGKSASHWDTLNFYYINNWPALHTAVWWWFDLFLNQNCFNASPNLQLLLVIVVNKGWMLE